MRGLGTILLWMLLIVGWISLCALGLLYIYSRVETAGQVPVEVLQWTVWPFIALSLGVPIILIILSGGLKFVSEIVEVNAALKSLPDRLQGLQSLGNELNGVTERIQIVSTSINQAVLAAANAAKVAESASKVVDEAASVTADLSARDSANSVLVDQLNTHYTRTKTEYERLRTQFETMGNADALNSVRGYLSTDNIDRFREANLLDLSKASYLQKVLEVEAGTRRWGRRNLTQEQISDLDQSFRQSGYT